MAKKNNLKIIILAAVMAGLAVGYFFILSKRGEKSSQDAVGPSELDTVLAKDLSASYPENPKAVVKFYSRILQCYMNEECTRQQQQKLGAQARLLMDEELLKKNGEDTFYPSLFQEIQEYKDKKMEMRSYTIDESGDTLFKKVEGKDYAMVQASYDIRMANTSLQTKYILREDGDGKWKIFGYKLLDGNEEENEAASSEIDKILAKDLTYAYPETPKAVVKFYSRILQCYMNEECTRQQQQKLGEQARMLMDEELLAKNRDDIFYANLFQEIQEYKDKKMEMRNYTIGESGDTLFEKVEGQEYAMVKASYLIRVANTSLQETEEEYVLRKDGDGKWKIFGYKLTDRKDVEDE